MYWNLIRLASGVATLALTDPRTETGGSDRKEEPIFSQCGTLSPLAKHSCQGQDTQSFSVKEQLVVMDALVN